MNSPGTVYRSSSRCAKVALGGSFIVSTLTRTSSTSRWRALAIHGAVGDEVVEVGVVPQWRAGDLVRRVVHEATEEAEGVSLRQSCRPDAVGELDFERRRLVVELRDGSVEVLFEERHVVRVESHSRMRHAAVRARSRAAGCSSVRRPPALVQQDQVQLERVELLPLAHSDSRRDVGPLRGQGAACRVRP